MMEAARKVARVVRRAGGRALIVGGFVRDMVMGRDSKDVDFELYGLSLDRVVEVLSTFGDVNAVGRAFGVLKVVVDGHDFDVSLPRTDSKVGHGHKGFVVTTDANMTPVEAAARRDFTMNAMSMDPLTGEVIDPFGGRADIEAGVLRHTSSQFGEDPLRVLRGMQFAARFDMVMAPETIAICRSLVDSFTTLPVERVWAEFVKMFTRGVRPSRGLDVLRQTGWIRHFPQVAAMIGCGQSPVHHPEGDVWNHTCATVDAAVSGCDD